MRQPVIATSAERAADHRPAIRERPSRRALVASLRDLQRAVLVLGDATFEEHRRGRGHEQATAPSRSPVRARR